MVRRFCVLLVLVCPLVLASCDWPMLGLNSAHTSDNTTESSIGVGNVATLSQQWFAQIYDSSPATGNSSPAVANGVVYVGSPGGQLSAFDATGTTGCSGSPKVCTPLWTGSTGGAIYASPAVSNGAVIVAANDGKIYAFDAAGSTNCSGSPKTCTPLWTATTGSNNSLGMSPVVSNNVAYVGGANGVLYAFDATGTTGCSGSPKVCTPLWTADVGSQVTDSPAVADGSVFVPTMSSGLKVFDAAGQTNCGGVPKVCLPLWVSSDTTESFVSVANGKVYTSGAGMEVFDEAGVTNCTGSPKTCTPLWTTPASLFGIDARPAVTPTTVYVGGDAFDAAGIKGCSAKICNPLWSYGTNDNASPSLANGLVYMASADASGGLVAFDATGTRDCSGTPIVCAPLFFDNTGIIESQPVIANGKVYATDTTTYCGFGPCASIISVREWGL